MSLTGTFTKHIKKNIGKSLGGKALCLVSWPQPSEIAYHFFAVEASVYDLVSEKEKQWSFAD